MKRVKVFLAPRFSSEQDLRLLNYPSVQLVGTIEEADFLLVPQFVREMGEKTRAYLTQVRRVCEAAGKQGIVCKGGDLSYKFHVEGFIVFASSIYSSVNPGELASPATTEDLSAKIPFVPRAKGEKPLVSFCGYAELNSLGGRIKYALKNAALDAAALVTGNPDMRVFKRGIYFRRKAMDALARDPRVDTAFIIRDTFSGKSGKEAPDPDRMRQEYLDNVIDSDFVLCPKGDGNYSSRFYRALNMGRIPILIDTDMVLPLEKALDYSKFILRVPYGEIDRLGDIVADFYKSISNEEFEAMQNRAREAFAYYLRHDSFYNTALPLLREQGLEAF